MKIKNEFEKKGYIILKNFFDHKSKKKILKIADEFTQDLIYDWGISCKNKSGIYKKIIKYYVQKKKPEYRREPNKRLATNNFFELINFKRFNELKKIIKKKNWYLSYYKNIRFKSQLLPWSSEVWHCDRYTFENDFYKKNFDFLICWFPLQNMNKKCEGGLKLIKKNDFFNKNFFYRQKFVNPKKLFNCEKLVNAFQKEKKTEYKEEMPKLNFGDLLVMDSRIVHKTIPVNSQKPFWSIDFRLEFDQKISRETQIGGVNLLRKYSKNLDKFKKTGYLKHI